MILKGTSQVIDINSTASFRSAAVALAGAVLALTCAPAGALANPKTPIYVYARPGDPQRFVWSVKGGRSMGIRGEGPLRARCFVLDNYYRELTLTGPRECAERACPSPEALAAAVDLRAEELPEDLVTIWRTGEVSWAPYLPDDGVRIDGGAAHGPHLLVGHEMYRIWTLSPGRGYLVVCYYGPGMTRVLRVKTAVKEYEIRPRSGLATLKREQRLVDSDICQHLEKIHEGKSVNWADIGGYRRY